MQGKALALRCSYAHFQNKNIPQSPRPTMLFAHFQNSKIPPIPCPTMLFVHFQNPQIPPITCPKMLFVHFQNKQTNPTEPSPRCLGTGFKNAQLVSEWSKGPGACARAHTMGQGHQRRQVEEVTGFSCFRSVVHDHAPTALDTMADTLCLLLL